ncbi:hypothetical protein EDB85DRAFT_2075854 [Lactarius pseudohatsudake]|nr:hypothetical protein EDB85DRAFT_2075854 [Lactarius pseudohatsudake]
MAGLFSPPYKPYDPTDKAGYETVIKRWPVILTTVIDSVYSVNHELTNLPDKKAAKLEEGKALIAAMSRLKYEMARDKPLEPIPADGEALIEEYNEELVRLEERGQNTWFTAPWFYAELLRSLFSTTQHWKTYNPFFSQKLNTYQASATAVHKLAATLAELESEKDIVANDPQKLQVLFREMAQMCLWCLLTNMTPEDIEHLQMIGRDAQNARKEFILKDDQDAAWQHITTLKDARIDFILDNGMPKPHLLTDLVFADFLVSHTPYVSKVVFHPKSIPWFVSDPSLLVPRRSTLSAIARWNGYLASGTFALSVARDAPISASDEVFNFWTSPWPYWDMRVRAPGVWNALRESGLVIFKTRTREATSLIIRAGNNSTIGYDCDIIDKLLL